MNSRATTPWIYWADTGEIFPKEKCYAGYPIAESVQTSNGKFIVMAVNAHDELVEVAKNLSDALLRKNNYEATPEILKLAEILEKLK